MARVSRKAKEPDVIAEQKIYKMGIYLRLSVEESSVYESDSIQNQRKILLEYIQSQPDMKLYQEYIDDGKTGTDFERPGFKAMLENIKSNRINGVIVKDISRFGRNFEETEEYLLTIFPYLKVRFVSVFDDYDSLYMNADMILMPIKNLFNDFYAKDVSRKVSSTFDRLRKEGKYWGPRPPYGYLIDPEDHHHLIIDQKTAGYVRTIFDRIIQGESYYQIIKWLHQNKIVPPMRRFYELGLLQNSRYNELTVWYRSTIVHILRNPAYYGALPVSKSKQSLWQNIPYHKIPQKEWECIENTHEAIISKEMYQKVQQIIDDKAKSAKSKYKNSEKSKRQNLFPYKMLCGSCKKSLKRNYYRQRDGSRGYYFLCHNSNVLEDMKKCPHTYITEKDLCSTMLEVIKKHINVICDVAALIENAQAVIRPDDKRYLIGQLEQLKGKYAEKDRFKKELYLDLKQGYIAEDEYVYMRDAYARELDVLHNQIIELEKQINIYTEKPEKMSPLVRKARKYMKLKELNAELVEIFIHRIEVFPSGELHIELNTKDELEELLSLSQQMGKEIRGAE